MRLVTEGYVEGMRANLAAAYEQGAKLTAQIARLTAENEQLRTDLEKWEGRTADTVLEAAELRARVQAIRDLCDKTIVVSASTLVVPVADLRAAIGDGDDRG